MAKCPHCHEEIDNLDWSETKVEAGFVVLRGRLLDYEADEDASTYSDLKHSCPLCKQLIATTELEVRNFLEGDGQ